MIDVIRGSAFLVGSLLLGTFANAAPAEKTELIPSVSSVDWKPAPATLPKGTKIVLLAGDPSEAGPFVL